MPVEGFATIGTTNLPGLLANEEMAKTVEPGALETCDAEQALEAVKLVRTRAQRIPSCAQSICSQKGRIHLRRRIGGDSGTNAQIPLARPERTC